AGHGSPGPPGGGGAEGVGTACGRWLASRPVRRQRAPEPVLTPGGPMSSTDRPDPRPGAEPSDRRRLWLFLAAVVGVVVLAIVAAVALGGGDDEDEPEAADDATTTTEVPPIAPLTGELVDDRSLIER